MKLIREEISVEVLTESNNGKKTFYIQGPFLQGDIKNRNGRIYSVSWLKRSIVTTKSMSARIGRWENWVIDGPTVNLDRVSHKITSLGKKAPTSWVKLNS